MKKLMLALLATAALSYPAVAQQAGAQRPQVVHVQAGGLDVDGDRAVGHVGVGALPDDEGVQGGVGFRLGGVDGEHVPNLAGGGPG